MNEHSISTRHTYVIKRQCKDISWYLFDINDNATPIRFIWTKSMKDATHFVSEQDAERACDKYFKNQVVTIVNNIIQN